MPVRAVDGEVLLNEGSHSLLLAEILIRLPLALLEDASSTPSYASAVRLGTCSCRAECFGDCRTSRCVGRRCRVAQRPPPMPQSTSMPKLFSLRYSDERAIPSADAACTRFPPASRRARTIASRSIDSSALSVLPEV